LGNERIGFIGGGNMTMAIAGGLLASGFAEDCLAISEPLRKQREHLADVLAGIAIGDDNATVASNVDCLVLAIKPQVLRDVCQQLADTVQQRKPLVVSIAAGVRASDIDAWLGGGLPVIRVMPNQPALLRLGVSGLFANNEASDNDCELAATVMAAVGKVVWVDDESDIDTVTAISGSGPAYFFLLVDMLIKTAIDMGLEPEAARTLATETAVGAAGLTAQTEDSMDDLIARVRSPGGTTAAALDSLEEQNVRAIFSAAVIAARNRADEVADEASK